MRVEDILTEDRTSQPEGLIDAISAAALDPLFWLSDRVNVESAWYGHVPFAHWLVTALAPRCIVELGSHNGVSYAAFCRAAQRAGLGTRCFAVDSWAGDEQAGYYDESVYIALRAYHDERFSAFSTLIRRSFDDALALVPDGSIDLLHIDGRHGYQEVRHDFDAWRSKMSDRGVVLLHDTAVFEDGFGVWRLWSELRPLFPNFEFLHAHGLGVLAVGAHCPPAVAALAELSDGHASGPVRERFARFGERCALEAQVKLLEQRSERQIRRQDALTAQLQAAEAAQMTAEAALATLRSDAEAARQECADANAAAQADREQLGILRREQARAVDSGALLARAQNLQRRAAADAALYRIERGWVWRASRPIRTGLAGLPAPIRRPGYQALRAVWRILTPQLNELRTDLRHAAPPESTSFEQTNPAARPVAPHVCYMIGEPMTPGAHYRVHRYAASCEMIGARVTVLRPDELVARAGLAQVTDIMVIWRAVWTDALAAFVRAARDHGARIVFDVDDLMIDPALVTTAIIDGIRSQNLNEDQVRAHYGQVQRTMLEADYCSASTAELAGHMRRFTKTCFTLPNGFDQETLRASRIAARRRQMKPGDGLLRLGYASGSLTHQKDFADLAAALPAVLRAHPSCRLVIFRSRNVKLVELEEFPDLLPFTDRIEWRDLVPLAQLPAEIARFDINLVPLQAGNPFCEAKSELKYFEAALAGVCTVASPVGPYARAIRHGSNGFLAANPTDWEIVLTQLLGDPALRRQVAQTALSDVLWTYGPDRRAQLMRRVLAEWQGGESGAEAFVLELGQRSGVARPGVCIPAGEVMFCTDTLRLSDVTVAVPLYNYADTLVEALESVRRQSLRALDLIIVDDRSTDRSLETALAWVRSHAGRFNRVMVIRNQENSGVGFSRNAAFAAAETDYVLPLDADNRLRPRCCEQLLAAVRESKAGFAYPVIQEFGRRSGLIGDAPYHPSRFIGGNYIDAMALIARSAWSAAGGYTQIRMGWEDYDFWCALAEAGLRGCPVAGAPLAEYRAHNTSMLAQVTDTDEVKGRVIAAIEQRHPWVAVARPLETAAPASATGRALSGQHLRVVDGGLRAEEAVAHER